MPSLSEIKKTTDFRTTWQTLYDCMCEQKMRWFDLDGLRDCLNSTRADLSFVPGTDLERMANKMIEQGFVQRYKNGKMRLLRNVKYWMVILSLLLFVGCEGNTNPDEVKNDQKLSLPTDCKKIIQIHCKDQSNDFTVIYLNHNNQLNFIYYSSLSGFYNKITFEQKMNENLELEQ